MIRAMKLNAIESPPSALTELRRPRTLKARGKTAHGIEALPRAAPPMSRTESFAVKTSEREHDL